MTAPSCGSSWHSSEGQDPASTYARDVVAGHVPAGQWHRKACERHLRDLATAEAQGLRWEPWRALRVVLVARLCRHFKGRAWAGRPVELEPWELFIIGSIFGWVRASTGYRRFVDAFIEVPRGQGKSTLAAVIVLFMTFFDGEPGADSYCYATKKEQARIVFRTARRFVLSSPALRQVITPYRSTLFNEETDSKIEILGSDSDNQDGLRPHCAIADEIHKQKTPDMMEVVESGMGTLDQPLHFKITTAGESAESVYEQQVNISTQVLDGSIDIPEWFCFIAAADEADDPESEDTWRKANPNYGISVNPDFLRKELRKARANPSEWAKFRRLYLGQKVTSADSYFGVEDWDACDQPMLPDDVLRRFPCWVGVDLSSRIDTTAVIAVWLLEGADVGLPPGEWVVLRGRIWLPGEHAEDRRRRDRVPYPTWIESGYLETTEGNVIDQRQMREYLVTQQQSAWPLLREVAYDPWNAGELAQRLQDDHGFVMVEARQGPQTLSAPTKRLKEALMQRRVIHGGQPVLRWMLSNVRCRTDVNGNLMPSKKHSRGRIDGAVAATMGLWRAMLRGNATPPAAPQLLVL